MSKFAITTITDLTLYQGKEALLEELNKERMRRVGFSSNYAEIVQCPYCGKESLAAPVVKGEQLLPPAWKRKQKPRDLAKETNPPGEKEIQAMAELAEAKKELDQANMDMGNLIFKIGKGNKKTYIATTGEYQTEKLKYKEEEIHRLTAEAQNILNEKAKVWQKAKTVYDNLYQRRLQRIHEYQANEEKKATEKLEQAKQKKKSTNWRGKIKEIIST